MENKRSHWETVYETKNPDQVSWTQDVPKTSLEFIHSFHLSTSASIIDIGGGDSTLVDHLLHQGYENITVLDISQRALDKAKERFGNKAKKVKWILTDVTEFEPTTSYDIWHDRATFHFLTKNDHVEKYLNIARICIKRFMTIGTFSTSGPTKCSGLEIKQYNEKALTDELANGFEKLKCISEVHTTPFNTKQDFLFCSFKSTTKDQFLQ